jgi:hypothetical protein
MNRRESKRQRIQKANSCFRRRTLCCEGREDQRSDPGDDTSRDGKESRLLDVETETGDDDRVELRWEMDLRVKLPFSEVDDNSTHCHQTSVGDVDEDLDDEVQPRLDVQKGLLGLRHLEDLVLDPGAVALHAANGDDALTLRQPPSGRGRVGKPDEQADGVDERNDSDAEK